MKGQTHDALLSAVQQLHHSPLGLVREGDDLYGFHSRGGKEGGREYTECHPTRITSTPKADSPPPHQVVADVEVLHVLEGEPFGLRPVRPVDAQDDAHGAHALPRQRVDEALYMCDDRSIDRSKGASWSARVPPIAGRPLGLCTTHIVGDARVVVFGVVEDEAQLVEGHVPVARRQPVHVGGRVL